MAFLEFKNVRIAGFSAGVPKQVLSNLTPNETDGFSKEYTPEEFVKTTGVQERHVSDTLCTSDLCFHAAERLIADLKWDKSEIQALIFVSQTADYILPCTSCILQDRLALSKECYAADCTLGCSGWVYGLSQVLSLLSNGTIKKALLLCGDAKKRADGPRDPLFGHAGTATAVEFQEGAEGFKFHFGTDGSGYDAIITPDGGSRNQTSVNSFVMEEIEGKPMHRMQTRMKGMDVFAFGISVPPKSIKKLAEHYCFDYSTCDYLILHQANMKMNNMIAKKLKFTAEKVPSCMLHYGNTSSASIPLTIVTELRDKCNKLTKFICCGFGVGLSWGTVYFETENIVISDLVEVEELTESEQNKWV